MFKFVLITILTLIAGMLMTWVDRKVSARLQYRQGPPWFQPFADAAKLLGKETFVPAGASKLVFLGAPLVGFSAALLAAYLLFSNAGKSIGDVIALIYLLMLPSIAVMLGASASRNPLAALGASREMKLILVYELPFILAILVMVYKSGTILPARFLSGVSISGLLAFLAALLAVQAKLGAVPFDIPEAEQEIAAGTLIEYSGPPLLLFRLTRALLYVVLPAFLIDLFLGGIEQWFLVKYLLVLVLIILIKNTNPRLRSDQAVRFFWGPVTVLAATGFVLAVVGL